MSELETSRRAHRLFNLARGDSIDASPKQNRTRAHLNIRKTVFAVKTFTVQCFNPHKQPISRYYKKPLRVAISSFQIGINTATHNHHKNIHCPHLEPGTKDFISARRQVTANCTQLRATPRNPTHIHASSRGLDWTRFQYLGIATKLHLSRNINPTIRFLNLVHLTWVHLVLLHNRMPQYKLFKTIHIICRSRKQRNAHF